MNKIVQTLIYITTMILTLITLIFAAFLGLIALLFIVASGLFLVAALFYFLTGRTVEGFTLLFLSLLFSRYRISGFGRRLLLKMIAVIEELPGFN